MTSWGEGDQGFCDDSYKALVIKSVSMGRRSQILSKIVMTSFMDDPFEIGSRFPRLLDNFRSLLTKEVPIFLSLNFQKSCM